MFIWHKQICEFWNFVNRWVSLSSRNINIEIIRKQIWQNNIARVVTSCNPNLCALLSTEKKDEVGNDDVTIRKIRNPSKNIWISSKIFDTSSSISNSPTEYMRGEELNWMARSRKLMVMISTVGPWWGWSADSSTQHLDTCSHVHLFLLYVCCQLFVCCPLNYTTNKCSWAERRSRHF